MKKFLLTLIAIIFLLASSCKDECKDLKCLNRAECNDGTCICPTGFSGEFCEVEDQAALYGSYLVSGTNQCTSSNHSGWDANFSNKTVIFQESPTNSGSVEMVVDFATIKVALSGNNFVLSALSGYTGSGKFENNNMTFELNSTVVAGGEDCKINVSGPKQ